MTFNKVRGGGIIIYKHSGKWHLFWYIQLLILTISSSFLSQSTLFWELFKWEKICNLVQIGGIVMFKNLFYYVTWNLHRFLFVYAVNYSSEKENQNWQKSVSAGHTSKKIGIGQENCNRCISSVYFRVYNLPCLFEHSVLMRGVKNRTEYAFWCNDAFWCKNIDNIVSGPQSTVQNKNRGSSWPL